MNSLDQEQDMAMNNLRNGETDWRSHGSASQISSTSDHHSSGMGLTGEGEELLVAGDQLTGEGGICEQCGEPMCIAEPIVNYEGRLWHPSCFV